MRHEIREKKREVLPVAREALRRVLDAGRALVRADAARQRAVVEHSGAAGTSRRDVVAVLVCVAFQAVRRVRGARDAEFRALTAVGLSAVLEVAVHADTLRQRGGVAMRSVDVKK